MKKLALVLMFFLIAAIFASCASREVNIDDTELLSVFIVSRHGIRSQTQTLDYLNEFTLRPQGFPLWSTPADIPGNLSTKGMENVTKLGAWYRDYYAAQGLLPSRGTCPASNAVFVYANVFERTLQTAQGYIDGLFQGESVPDCNIQVNHSDLPVDPYFLPLSAGLCRVDSAEDSDILNDSLGGNPDILKTTYASQLQLLQEITQCCELDACVTAENPNPTSCTLLELPSAISVTAGTGKVQLLNLFYMLDQISEQFQLEYAEGMTATNCPSTPGAQCVGWGVIPTSAELYEAMSFRGIYTNLVERLPSYCHASASNLMMQAIGTMDQTISGVKGVDTLAPLGSRFTLFVGHDTDSINAIGGLLNVDWHMEGYPPNDQGPAGALVFELRKTKQGGQNIVRLFHVIASLDQMRNGTVLSLRDPPLRQQLMIPSCGTYDCPYDTFKAFVISNVRQDCITKKN